MRNRTIRVLGVDPAAAGATGYGLVETDGRSYHSLGYGALRASRGRGSFAGRLREIHALIGRLVEEFRPDAVAVESVFTALNMKTALRLAEVRGVVMLAAAERSIPVHSYSPREVKASVTGQGHATKHQMQQMVRTLLSLPQPPEPADAADALAVALCHLHLWRAQQRFAAATALEPRSRRAAHGRAAARI